jgi:chromosome segregation ATPase
LTGPQEKGAKLVLTPDEAIQDLGPLLNPLKATLAEHRQPGQLPERYQSAEKNVSYLLSHSRRNGPLDRAAEVGKLQELVTKLDSTLALLEGQDTLEAEIAPLKKKRDAAKAELERRQKDAPTLKSERAALQEALATLDTALEERRGRAAKGREKVQERVTRRVEFFHGLRAQVDAAEKAVVQLESENAQAHEQNAQAQRDTVAMTNAFGGFFSAAGGPVGNL